MDLHCRNPVDALPGIGGIANLRIWQGIRGDVNAYSGSIIHVIARSAKRFSTRQSRITSAGNSMLPLHFGLGDETITDLTVRWPDGLVTQPPLPAPGQ